MKGTMRVAKPKFSHRAEADSRSTSRYELNLPTNAAQSGREFDLAIVELSKSGLKARVSKSSSTPKAVEELQIHLSEGIVRHATVVWAEKETFGARFDQQLSPADLAATRLVSRSRSPRTQTGEVEVKLEKQDHFMVADPYVDEHLSRSSRLRIIVLAAVSAWVTVFLVAQIFWSVL
jgi:hypothetical protein